MKHVCHPLNEKHKSCLVKLYQMYFGLVQSTSSEITAFYFKPNSKRLAYDKMINRQWESINSMEYCRQCARKQVLSQRVVIALEEKWFLLFSNISFLSRDIQVFKICKLAK